MTFHDVRFPESISNGATGGPVYSTDVIRTKSGGEKRNINWQASIYKFDVSQTVKTEEEKNELIEFFHARDGKGHSFRFKDWSDYTVVGGNIGTGDGSTTTFQLRKQYINGSITKNRTITKPVQGTLIVKVNGVTKTETSDYTVAYNTGIITFLSPPAGAAAITATFEFDIPCRFDIDEMKVTLVAAGVYAWEQIPIVSVME